MTTVSREELVRIVAAAASVAPRRTPMPILGCVRLFVRDGQLCAQATDLETAVVGEIPCDGPDGDLGIVSAPQLLSLLRGIVADRVELAPEGERLRVAFGVGAISFASFAAAEWPDAVKANGAGNTAMVAGAALSRIGRVLYAVGDQTRPDLAGIILKDGEFVAVSSHRLAKTPGLPEIGPFAIPLGAARAIVAVFADADEVAVAIDVDQAAVSLRRPGLHVAARVRLDGLAPYEHPHEEAVAGQPIVVPREPLLTAVRLLGSAGAETIAFVPRDGNLSIEPRGVDGPEGGIGVPVDGQLPDVVVVFDQRYAEQAVAQMEGEHLTMNLSPNKLAPVAVHDEHGNVAVVMPVRL